MDDGARIERLLGRRPLALQPLQGAGASRALCARFASGDRVMAKRARPGQPPRLEARMLADLRAAGLPVPDILAVDDGMLVLAWFDHDPAGLPAAAQRAAGRALAQLHGAPCGDGSGHGYDTTLGGLPQPNPATPRWRDFFRDQRLLLRADGALAAGRLPPALRRRIDGVAARLDEWIDEPAAPSLLHGDLWGGHMLGRADGAVAFINPAIHRGHAEADLAMATLFGSVDMGFLDAYQEARPLRPGFFTVRRNVYNLVPLLALVERTGAAYVPAVEQALELLGC
ncbi:fructosamine kinase family protein [Ramlibacter sp. H39-3-26]|uniref:fructosamine kinase family protein n=1 Tax=Curvibacter soli TaxID=3031331 RepID=UPI0023DBD279|nr:fructosamine kinase family protein [Ramlibacter sp. H39-3-26]MDF1485025.1 fructosamine kinase family protein [Ramlibacter sp. H39-3-26]